MKNTEFKPGFRLSILDAFIITCGIGGVLLFYDKSKEVSLVIGFVVFHFFMFCNVFRISRPPELIWAFVFILLAYGTLKHSFPGWWITILVSLAVAALNIALEMKKPSYHGVFWKKVNPNLPDWWKNMS